MSTPGMRTPIILDIETGDADEQYNSDPVKFFRLGGIQKAGEGDLTHFVTRPWALAAAASLSSLTVGHNIWDFDFPLLDRAQRAAGAGTLDYIKLARERRALDTMTTASVVYPAPAELPPGAVKKVYKLDSIGPKLTGVGKSDDLPALAKKHGGYDRIPLDDPEYRAYLAGDLTATRALAGHFLAQGISDYVWREQRVAAIAGHMKQVGIRVDRPLLEQRYQANRTRKLELIDDMVRKYDIPLTNDKGKPYASPATSKLGKQKLLEAFWYLGLDEPDLPRTAKSKTFPHGQVSFKGDDVVALGEKSEDPAVKQLCEAIAAMVGVRTIYQTVTTHLMDDDRVHPSISMFQASGRWSTTDPGMTVMGKRGGKVIEREVMLPDSPNEVFVAFDLSQVDARTVAVQSQDHAYLDMFAPGVDLHAEVAKLVWGIDAYNANPAGLRDRAKALGHGSNYGMGPDKLASTAGVPLSEAQLFHRTQKELFPRKAQWASEVVALARTGATLDNGFGRRMRCTPGREFTQAPALMGQGGTRDIMMEGTLRLPDDIARMARIQVHDELVFSIPIKHVEEIERVIIDCLSFEWAPPHASRPVFIPADKSRRGRNWAECYAKAA